MVIFRDFFVYTILSEDNKTAKLGDDSRANGNGFVQQIHVIGKIVIPNDMDGYRIISIATYAFRLCSKITELKLPNTLLTIQNAGVSDIDSIKKLVVPASVISIGTRLDYFRDLIYFEFEKGTRIESIGLGFLQYCEKNFSFLFYQQELNL